MKIFLDEYYDLKVAKGTSLGNKEQNNTWMRWFDQVDQEI
jgi:hypothetical protein